MSTAYMVARDGEQFGPYEPRVLLDYVAQGHIVPEDHIWCEGMADWETLSQIKERIEREVTEAAAAEAKPSAAVDTPLPAPTVLDMPQANEPPSTVHDRHRQASEAAAGQSVAAATVLDTPTPAPTVLDAPQANAFHGKAQATQRNAPGAAVTERDSPAGNTDIPELPPALARRYRILRLLARGGEGFILLAEGRADEGQRVIKLYVPSAGSSGPKGAVLDNISAEDKAHVVHIHEHGKEGIWYYEVQEYLANGSLRDLMTGPRPLTEVESMLRELSDALRCLHGAKLIHRDLKPENILIRNRTPLDLVLTDFGIASVSEATLHETTRSRTVLYSAPEAMNGIVSDKSDWWSIGIILVELISGRHPLAGIGSQNRLDFYVAQNTIDTEGVSDPRWRTLCRGLLVRNAANRWGSDEVVRWLAGETVPVADDPGIKAEPVRASGQTVPYRPYTLSGTTCATPLALAAALLQFWDEGIKHLTRGFILKWIADEVKDYDLSSYLTDLAEGDLSLDARLAALVYRIDPTLPPVWKGRDVSRPALLAWANAVQKDGTEREAFYEVWTTSLPLLPHADLKAFRERVSGAIASFDALWPNAAASVEAATGSEPVAPEMPSILPRLILALEHPPALEQLRAAVRQAPKPGSIPMPGFLSADSGGAAALVLIAYLREARLANVGICGGCHVETGRICKKCHNSRKAKSACSLCGKTGYVCDSCYPVRRREQEGEKARHEAAMAAEQKKAERKRQLPSTIDKEIADWKRENYGVFSHYPVLWYAYAIAIGAGPVLALAGEVLPKIGGIFGAIFNVAFIFMVPIGLGFFLRRYADIDVEKALPIAAHFIKANEGKTQNSSAITSSRLDFSNSRKKTNKLHHVGLFVVMIFSAILVIPLLRP